MVSWTRCCCISGKDFIILSSAKVGSVSWRKVNKHFVKLWSECMKCSVKTKSNIRFMEFCSIISVLCATTRHVTRNQLRFTNKRSMLKKAATDYRGGEEERKRLIERSENNLREVQLKIKWLATWQCMGCWSAVHWSRRF